MAKLEHPHASMLIGGGGAKAPIASPDAAVYAASHPFGPFNSVATQLRPIQQALMLLLRRQPELVVEFVSGCSNISLSWQCTLRSGAAALGEQPLLVMGIVDGSNDP
eukprot:568185-Pelagomonas_calceolata.AAC.1